MAMLDNEHTFKKDNRELNVVYDGELVWMTFYVNGKAEGKAIWHAEDSKSKIMEALQNHGVETAT
jgi:hypothetical protein